MVSRIHVFFTEYSQDSQLFANYSQTVRKLFANYSHRFAQIRTDSHGVAHVHTCEYVESITLSR